jgi:hypothetical protein
MGISLVCTSLAEKAPVSGSVRRRSSMVARILVLRQENGNGTELVAHLRLHVIDPLGCLLALANSWRCPVFQQRQSRTEVARLEGRRRTTDSLV